MSGLFQFLKVSLIVSIVVVFYDRTMGYDVSWRNSILPLHLLQTTRPLPPPKKKKNHSHIEKISNKGRMGYQRNDGFIDEMG